MNSVNALLVGTVVIRGLALVLYHPFFVDLTDYVFSYEPLDKLDLSLGTGMVCF